jgi:hypothetical protein
MSVATQLSELELKHRTLDRELEDELSHPQSDSLRIAELKRKKLQLKDEIVRLRSETGETVH